MLPYMFGVFYILLLACNKSDHIFRRSHRSCNHIAGTLASSIIVILAMLGMKIGKTNLLNAPFYAYLGGVMGALFVILSNFTFYKTSVITSTILILSGQFLSSVLVDILVLQKEISLKNIAGAIIIILSVILYNNN